jgi:hypothetical protein
MRVALRFYREKPTKTHGFLHNNAKKRAIGILYVHAFGASRLVLRFRPFGTVFGAELFLHQLDHSPYVRQVLPAD